MKAVIDTNVLVPAVWRAEGSPGPVLDAWFAREFELVTSEPILSELEEVLSYPSTRRRRGWSAERVVTIMRTLHEGSYVVDPMIQVEIVRDRTDNKFVEAALAAEADYIVSVDNDLLTLEHFGDIRIVTPGRFLAILREAS